MEQLLKIGLVQAAARLWGGLNKNQRFITVIFVSTSLVLLCVVSVVATRPETAVLFSGLSAEDSGAVLAKLQESKVPYQVDDGAIKVPAKRVYETRMQLANQGLPRGGSVGFELFDKTSFGLTEFSQRLNYQRALQGELSRTIDELSEIAASRVHLAIPEPSVFQDREKEATASVVVKLAPGSRLDSNKVAGIVHLVSSAVEGLKPNRVTVVDTDGNLLSESTDEATGLDPRLSASQLRLKREYERQVEQTIQTMLEPVLGQDRAIVRANAEINFDRTETESETFEPAGPNTGVLASEERLEETYDAGAEGRSVGGVAGVSSTLRPRPLAESPRGEAGYQRRETTAKYEVSKTTQHVIRAPGQLGKLSVAVMVDSKTEGTKLPAIQNAVTAAAGIDPERGDRITVESVAFDDTAAKKQEKELKAIASRSTYVSVAKTVGSVLLLFGFLFFLRNLLRQIRITVPEQIAAVLDDASVPGASALRGYDSPPASGNGGVPGAASAEPQQVAQALRRWMSEPE